MRFNKAELLALARLPSNRYEKEGRLYTLERQEGIFRKAEVRVERWCRLKGNLLFYFRDRERVSEPPLGCVILNNCDVQIHDRIKCVELEGYYSFYVIFSRGVCEVLAAENGLERLEWITAIRTAIYEIIRTDLYTLQHRLSTGVMALRENIKWHDARANLFHVPSCEVTFSCRDLPASDDRGRPPNPMVVIEAYMPTLKSYVHYDATEMVGKRFDPTFSSTVVFYPSTQIDENSLLRITVLDVREPTSGTTVHLGSAFLLLKTIQSSVSLKIPLKLTDNSEKGTLLIQSWKFGKELKATGQAYTSLRSCSSGNLSAPSLHRSLSLPSKLKVQTQFPDVSNWKFLSSPFMQSYNFRSALGGSLHVYEFMFESRLCFQLPQDLLDIWINQERGLIQEIVKLGDLKEPWNARKAELLNRHSGLIQQYGLAKSNMQKEASNGFKQSSRKFDESVEFAATNLHLQCIWACDSSSNKSATYDWVTVGSFTAHSHKLNNSGGLIKLVQQLKESPIKSGLDYQISVKISMANDAIHAITQLKKEVLDCMRSLTRLAVKKETNGMLIICDGMIAKTRSLLNIWDPILAEEAFIFMEEHKVMAPAGITATTTAATTDNSDHLIRQLLLHDSQEQGATNGSSPLPCNGSQKAYYDPDEREIEFLGADSVTTPVECFKLSEELEPWDIIQLNIEASVMCLVSKVKFLCGRCSSPAVRLKQTHNKKTPSEVNKSLKNRNRFVEGLDLSKITDWAGELRPSMRKLHRAMCGLLRTAHQTLAVLKVQQEPVSSQKVRDVQYRRDVCFSQALTALVTGLMTKLWVNKTDTVLAEILQDLGPLATFECLLTLHGGEIDMWGDMAVAIEDLRTVRFTLKSSLDSQALPKISGNRYSMTVILPVPYNFHVSTNQYFHVTPVFFNVGVNESAALADKTGANVMQHRSNVDNFERLNEYALRFQKLKLGDECAPLHGPLAQLRAAVHSDRPKDVDVLHLSARVARLMRGLQFVSCKSAKDRTGMFVTLDQCQILRDDFCLAEGEFQEALDCMRSVGCRRENTMKNINVRRYAFNSVQLQSLPRLYRPPQGTYGSSET